MPNTGLIGSFWQPTSTELLDFVFMRCGMRKWFTLSPIYLVVFILKFSLIKENIFHKIWLFLFGIVVWFTAGSLLSPLGDRQTSSPESQTPSQDHVDCGQGGSCPGSFGELLGWYEAMIRKVAKQPLCRDEASRSTLQTHHTCIWLSWASTLSLLNLSSKTPCLVWVQTAAMAAVCGDLADVLLPHQRIGCQDFNPCLTAQETDALSRRMMHLQPAWITGYNSGRLIASKPSGLSFTLLDLYS